MDSTGKEVLTACAVGKIDLNKMAQPNLPKYIKPEYPRTDYSEAKIALLIRKAVCIKGLLNYHLFQCASCQI